ncbi:hypothetical protein ACFP3I_25000 [Chryseobacterium arachidis]
MDPNISVQAAKIQAKFRVPID